MSEPTYHPRALPGVELRVLHLYVKGRYLKRLSGRFRSIPSKTALALLVERGYVTVDGDLRNGAITVTDEGRAYAAAHPVR